MEFKHKGSTVAELIVQKLLAQLQASLIPVSVGRKVLIRAGDFILVAGTHISFSVKASQTSQRANSVHLPPSLTPVCCHPGELYTD